jgi:hypothetical protein
MQDRKQSLRLSFLYLPNSVKCAVILFTACYMDQVHKINASYGQVGTNIEHGHEVTGKTKE